MNRYLVLLRGINVGGKNKVPMADLKTCLQDLGFVQVSTYIASGNVILTSDLPQAEIKARIERALPRNFQLGNEQIKVLVLTRDQLRSVIASKPQGFGEHPEQYHSDVIFLIDIASDQAMAVFDPRAGVDNVWAGDRVIYSQRLSSLRTKSRLSKIMGTPAYKSMTIRTWNSAAALLKLLDSVSTELPT